MNTRQWELYNLLKKRALEDITKWVSKQEIVNALPDWYEIKEGETRTCRDIEFDVKDINMDDTIQKTREINLKVATLESMAKLQKEHPFIILGYR